jgi:diamine N-acetyltransferase
MNNQKKSNPQITLQPVNSKSWRAVIKLEVEEAQREFVADTGFYLALCNYGGNWHPLAILLGELVVGFMMWAVDTEDQSCWLGGILIDKTNQGKGYGWQAVQNAIEMLEKEHGHNNFALSYKPSNLVGKHIYKGIGFIETDVWEGEEIVSRMKIAK